MKKILTALVISLFVLSIPLAAQAGSLGALEAKASALLGQGYRSALQNQAYQYGVVFAYSDNTEYWWSGLVLFNLAESANSLMVGCFDPEGNAVAAGTFSLEANALRADLLGDFMSSGAVSGRVSIAIFGTEAFLADRFVGNDAGGFGEIEKEAALY